MHSRSPGRDTNCTKDTTMQTHVDSNRERMAAAGIVGAIEVINEAKLKTLRAEEKATSDHSDQWSGNSSLLLVSLRSKVQQSLLCWGFTVLID